MTTNEMVTENTNSADTFMLVLSPSAKAGKSALKQAKSYLYTLGS